MHAHLLFKKVCVCSVQKMLNLDQKRQRVAVSVGHLDMSEFEGNKFLRRTVICKEPGVHNFTPESKRSSMECGHKRSRPPSEFKAQLSAGKIWQICFGIQKVIHADFLPHDVITKAQYCSNLPHNDLCQAIRRK
jgi:hypothetical protein